MPGSGRYRLDRDLRSRLVGVVVLCLMLNGSVVGARQAGKVHIVYMGEKVRDLLSHQARHLHLQTLRSAIGESDEECGKRIHYSYSGGFNGFAASLSDEEVDALSEMPGVVSVFPSNLWKLATTRSYNFLGLDAADPAGIWNRSQFGKGIVIGLFDSGIWPEARSFSPVDMPPPPLSWKGTCAVGEQFAAVLCNNKLVGAKYYFQGFLQQHGGLVGSIQSARDEEGHGTHVASTAAGSLVQGASLDGLAYGDARGGAPLAHIAMYKICWVNAEEAGCTDADILAAFDDAILDGVDIISLSLAGPEQRSYFFDAIAIGGYHAMQRGIFVTAAAGNKGPDPGSVVNVAPWLTTVAANTIDREFQATLKLGNNQVLEGLAINTRNLSDKFYPLVYAADSGFPPNAGALPGSCGNPDSLDPAKVYGAIVLCTSDDYYSGNLSGPAILGAAGMILPIDYNASSSAYDIPASQLILQDADSVLFYIKSNSQPVATIETTTRLNYTPAPVMAPFSAAGPNPMEAEILKPDVTAPGVNILAAWTPITPPTADDGIDNRIVEFNMLSGTSMATPHVAGIAAIVKALHRDWSPAAIKSALMTTATVGDNTGNRTISTPYGPSSPFDFGSGMINPVAASDPGLVYDITPAEYENFLCAAAPWNQTAIATLTGNLTACSAAPLRLLDLNYPSISVPNLVGSESVVRTLTNVGPAPAVNYTAIVTNPVGVNLTVVPPVLSFVSLGQRLAYALQLTVYDSVNVMYDQYSFGAVQWTDGVHSVRSPVAVRPGRQTQTVVLSIP